MRLGFATDIHLDHVKTTRQFEKQKRVGRDLTKDVDLLVLGGDLSVGKLLQQHMQAFLEGATCPVYFVLGNHDFWLLPESRIWDIAKGLGGGLDFLDVVEVTPDTALVGLSGWYDTRAGNVFNPGIVMPEVETTTRLAGLGPVQQFKRLFWPPERIHELHNRCKAWSDEQTAKFMPKLKAAAEKYRKVFIVTHIPPWIESCWGPTGLSRDVSPEWLPWSVNVGLGMHIEALAEEYPDVQFQVLSGHTHGEGETEVAWNLRAFSGKATYKQPSMARVFEVEEDKPLWVPEVKKHGEYPGEDPE
jgi:predicted phosphohydrolase